MDVIFAANIIVGVLFFIFWLLSFFILYHLTRFGVGILPKRLSALFLMGAIGLFSAALLLYSTLDLNAIFPKI